METLQLIEQICSGRDVKKSEEALYAKTREALLARIDRKIGGKVQARLDPEDVLDEAFLRGMKALSLFKASNGEAFFAWIYTIAKNLIIDQSKRRSIAAVPMAIREDERGPRASRIQAGRRRPESILMQHEQVDILLARLKPKEAEIIRLHRIEGLNFAEIAQLWKKTPGAVQRCFSRAWNRLRDLAGEDTD